VRRHGGCPSAGLSPHFLGCRCGQCRVPYIYSRLSVLWLYMNHFVVGGFQQSDARDDQTFLSSPNSLSTYGAQFILRF